MGFLPLAFILFLCGPVATQSDTQANTHIHTRRTHTHTVKSEKYSIMLKEILFLTWYPGTQCSSPKSMLPNMAAISYRGLFKFKLVKIK